MSFSLLCEFFGELNIGDLFVNSGILFVKTNETEGVDQVFGEVYHFLPELTVIIDPLWLHNYTVEYS
jgi:hypothetical protein